MSETEIKVPNIGDFKDAEVIEVLVTEGQSIKKNDALITIESDKSSVEIPSNLEGKIKNLKIKVGDKVSEGDLILTVDSDSEVKKEEVKEDKKYEHGIGKVNSAFEVGTPEYRQHTQSITPGQDITDYQRFKVQSMKEALAKVWGLDEAKKEEKDLTKEGEHDKTLTGKKPTKVDVDPELKDK